MKELKTKKIYLEEYGVEVKPYLTYAEVQLIINGIKKFGTWSEREIHKDMMLMVYATDIEANVLEEIGHDKLLQSGLIDAVRYSVVNFEDIDRGVAYEESLAKTLTTLATKLPDIADKVKEVTKDGAPSKK